MSLRSRCKNEMTPSSRILNVELSTLKRLKANKRSVKISETKSLSSKATRAHIFLLFRAVIVNIFLHVNLISTFYGPAKAISRA